MELLIIAITLIWTLYRFITRNENYWKERNVASPESVPFFGNYKEFVFGRKYIGDLYQELYEKFPKEKVVGYYRMMTPILLIRDPEIIKQIMIQDFEVFPYRGVNFNKNKLGNNLLHSDPETWKCLRNHFTSMFTPGKLKSMVPILVDVSDKLLDYIESHRLKKTEQEFHTIARNYAVATTMACVFDLNLDTFSNANKIAESMDYHVFHNSMTMLMEDTQPNTLKNLNISMYPKAVQNFCKHLANVTMKQKVTTRQCIINVISELVNKKQIAMENNNNGKVLKVTEELITGQAFVFYVAGYVNTAIVISFMLYQLALNPDIQDRLIEEIDTVVSKNNGNITSEAINEMVYLDRAFYEILRMYTPSASIHREAVRDYKIPGTDVVIKKGGGIAISPAALHYDEKYYPNPYQFDPDRFTPENAKNCHPCTYLAFGTGPRNCIGMRFAKFQMSVCIAKILSKYNVRLSKNSPLKMKYEPSRSIMYPRDGVYLNVVPRATATVN